MMKQRAATRGLRDSDVRTVRTERRCAQGSLRTMRSDGRRKGVETTQGMTGAKGGRCGT